MLRPPPKSTLLPYTTLFRSTVRTVSANKLRFTAPDPDNFEPMQLQKVDLTTVNGGSWDAKDELLAMNQGVQRDLKRTLGFYINPFIISGFINTKDQATQPRA